MASAKDRDMMCNEDFPIALVFSTLSQWAGGGAGRWIKSDPHLPWHMAPAGLFTAHLPPGHLSDFPELLAGRHP